MPHRAVNTPGTFDPRPGRGVLAAARWLFIGYLVAFSPVAAASPVELTQADGSVLRLEAPAQRLVTLSPHLAELVFEIGAGKLLVGTVSYSDHPPEARDLPKVGDAFRIDLERMLSLKPELVIAWDSGNPGPALDALDGLGLAVWRTEVRELEELARLLEDLGRATARVAGAEAAAGTLRDRIERLDRRYRSSAPVSYFYQVSERPLYTLSGQHLVSRALALCGGRNIFSNLTTLAPQVTRESVLQADPEVMLAGRMVREGGPGPLDAWRDWPRLQAVRHGQLHYVDADRMNRATPRMLDSVERACGLFEDWRRSRGRQTSARTGGRHAREGQNTEREPRVA
jgi:iron complex transport system substrate-binding protein